MKNSIKKVVDALENSPLSSWTPLEKERLTCSESHGPFSIILRDVKFEINHDIYIEYGTSFKLTADGVSIYNEVDPNIVCSLYQKIHNYHTEKAMKERNEKEDFERRERKEKEEADKQRVLSNLEKIFL